MASRHRPASLTADRAVRHCDPTTLGFVDTREVADLDEIVGQDRAVAAVAFGLGMRHEGYNVFVEGPEGTGRSTAIRRHLEHEAATKPVPDDWCYVFNFDEPRKPRALRLPAGRGRALRQAMEALARELAVTLPAAFETDAYRGRRSALEESVKQRRDAVLAEVEARAMPQHIALVRTPFGLAVAPMQASEVLDAEHFALLPEQERRQLQAAAETVEGDLQNAMAAIASLERGHRVALRALNRTVVQEIVGREIDEVRATMADLPAAVEFLEAVRGDLADRADEFIEATSGDKPAAPTTGVPPAFHRCEVNLIVDNAGRSGAPVLFEDLPTQPNLLGRIEHLAQFGALLTDFTLIKGGALHRANGGYLVLEVRRLLQQPFAWDELKRALRAGEVRLDGVPQSVAMLSTATIEPEPIPLEIKVVLVGDRAVLQLLRAVDPDFAVLFKVEADFDDWVERTPAREAEWARLLATVARREGLLPIEAAAMAAVVDRAARLVDDASKLSTRFGVLVDVLREADHLARQRGPKRRPMATRADVVAALAGRRSRAGRPAALLRDAIKRGLIRVETEGAEIGQVNGLSVAPIGDGAFGWPVRITVRVHLGRGDVLDIEREVELGGPIHSKGVLILGGFLAGRFGTDRPLALGASIVFEQSYSEVEGDSASLAELCGLISAIADVPVNQALAVTGSVDQLGRCQAVGGINDKIEGFYDICRERGLTGRQGVLIPAVCADTLMLRDDVVESIRQRRFAIHPVATVDEAIALLTGLDAGTRSAAGRYPESSINGRVAARLDAFAERLAEATAGDVLQRVH
jgi:predicted ATP-dependent protease